MNLADNIKKIRKEHNLSQEQFAEKLNVSRQSVSKWESGQAYPEMDKVIQICNLFNLNIDDLLTTLLKLKNEGCKEATIDPRKSKVCDRYGYLNLRDSEGNLRQKIRIIRK